MSRKAAECLGSGWAAAHSRKSEVISLEINEKSLIIITAEISWRDHSMLFMLRGKLPLVVLGLLGVLTLGTLPGSAIAATATTTFQVTATVQATCLISATDLAFGTYTGVQTDATSTVTVTCTNTTPWNIGLNVGTFSGATVTTRKMTGTDAAGLGYSLFRDSARTLNWGNTPPTDTVNGTGSGSAQAQTVFGRVPASQFVAPGGYADTITATITF